MDKHVSSPHNFFQRSLIVLPLFLAVFVILQIINYYEKVQKAEDKLFTSWPNQNEVTQYKARCERGSSSRVVRHRKTLITKFVCAKEHVSIDLANALAQVYASLPEPPPPLKYL